VQKTLTEDSRFVFISSHSIPRDTPYGYIPPTCGRHKIPLPVRVEDGEDYPRVQIQGSSEHTKKLQEAADHIYPLFSHCDDYY